MSDKALEILLSEYKALKDETKTIFSFQFTVIGIWLTFLSALIGVFFQQVKGIESQILKSCVTYEILDDVFFMPESRIIATAMIMALIPGICSLFGLIWLDLTARFIKEVHYIYTIEERIEEFYPQTLQWEHFLYFETKKEKLYKKTNYIYYCLMLGVIMVCYFLCVVGIFYFRNILFINSFWIIIFLLLVLFTIFFGSLYVLRILSYSKSKDESEKELDYYI